MVNHVHCTKYDIRTITEETQKPEEKQTGLNLPIRTATGLHIAVIHINITQQFRLSGDPA